MSAQHTPGPIDSRDRLIAELRDERDAAIAEVARLRGILENARFISVEAINALPEAKGWWPAGMSHSGRVVKLIRAAIAKATQQPHMRAAAGEGDQTVNQELLSLLQDAVASFAGCVEGGEADPWVKNSRAAIAKATGGAA